jgi:phosphopantetheinyl transferase (holo-ACP synthase)
VSRIAEGSGTKNIHVSLSHSGDYAVALVVVESRSQKSGVRRQKGTR